MGFIVTLFSCTVQLTLSILGEVPEELRFFDGEVIETLWATDV